MPNLGSLSHSHSHSRTISDVQGKVARFNSLNKEAMDRKRDADAAIRRAVLGREEAENETKKAKEEIKRLRRDVEESKQRETKVAERLDRVMVRSMLLLLLLLLR